MPNTVPKTRQRLTQADKIRIILAEPFPSSEDKAAVLMVLIDFVQKERAETLATEAQEAEGEAQP